MKIKLPTAVKTVGKSALSMLIAAAAQALVDAATKKLNKPRTPDA